MRSLLLAVTLFLAIGAGAQPITWRTAGSTLPKAQYTLHVSRDGELYAYSQAPQQDMYRYNTTARDWRKMRDGNFTKLQVISRDLAFAVENLPPGKTYVVLTEN